MPNHPLLLAAAVAHGVLGLGHTAKGLEQFKHPSLKQVPAMLRSTVQAGWYEGSLFFVIVAVLNYKWSMTGLIDGPDKGTNSSLRNGIAAIKYVLDNTQKSCFGHLLVLASLVTSLLFGFGANYYRTGDKPTAVTLALVGALQALGAKRAAL